MKSLCFKNYKDQPRHKSFDHIIARAYQKVPSVKTYLLSISEMKRPYNDFITIDTLGLLQTFIEPKLSCEILRENVQIQLESCYVAIMHYS